MKRRISFICNKNLVEAYVNPALTLLDFLRKNERLTGVKEGCREGDCGACSIMLGSIENNSLKYEVVNSCLFPIADADGCHVVTIEGINEIDLSPIQKSFINEGSTQCGFCTPGFIISLTCYLISGKQLNYADAIDSIGGNVCRCTGHAAIIRSVKSIMDSFINRNAGNEKCIDYLISKNYLPAYFKDIEIRLMNLKRQTVPEKLRNRLMIAGGTDLYVQRHDDLILEEEVDFIFNTGNKIYTENNSCFVEASATASDLGNSELLKNIFPGFEDFIKLFGSKPIRNRATIGGNIINASPIGDITSILLSLNSSLHITDGLNERILPLNEFYTGYKTFNLNSNEFIDKVSFKIPEGEYFFNYEKVSKRRHLDIASVNSSAFIKMNDGIIVEAKISGGGLAPIPLYLEKASSFLINKTATGNNLIASINIALDEVSPIDDVRGSAVYKKILFRQLLFAHFNKFFPEVITPEILI